MEDIESKEILIKDLPKSYEKDQLSSFCIDPETSHVHVVAKRGEGLRTDWAAYIGWPDLEHLSIENRGNVDCIYYATRQHTPEGVLATGDKLYELTAAQIFPEWAAAFTYRR